MRLFDRIISFRKEKSQDAGRPQPEGAVKTYRLNYQLSYDEIAESMTLICDKRSKKSRTVMGAVLFALAVGAVILYSQNPYGIHYAFAAIVMAVFSFVVWSYPSLKGRSSARKISKRKGTYKLVVSSDGYITPYGDDPVDLFEFPQGKSFETDNLFAIRADRLHSFCIPKRILSQKQLSEIRDILIRYSPAYSDNIVMSSQKVHKNC
ncbi:MAG: hypothetical protein SOW08_14210 [Lachnospiraceae bacterium]|nr:hypothetical protein [Lachnospiraceae bacterium]